uniref:Peroxisomal membrane protein PMP34 n=1 Tax=Arcella intermedia TaxID=1963864 RepID=A0A6B2LAX7_9EUKA|eukprot:TRINITY_DN26714_c0_g1_i1.p1 TRINITY_DN26714_c0_g1~~TRINITY_DN26714_c0_g1_i1.p1  ORF type:complete len:308 (-),score=35.27 TRINITY_DN26714_c0_g1_i1:59-982(-)
MSFSDVWSYSAFVHAISGATGGSIAMTSFYPLDVIRTYQQVDKKNTIIKIITDEGVSVLYRGLQATLISLYISNFVYFYANNMLKVLLKKITQKDVTVVQNLVIASLAGVVNVLITCPLWVANTRLKLQSKNNEKKYDGLMDCMMKIAQSEGVATLWSSVGASLLLVTNPTINFVAYDKVKSIFLKRAQEGNRNLTPLEIFAAGALAKTLATIFTYPIQSAQTKQRSGGHGHGQPRKTVDPKEEKKKEQTMNMVEVLYQVYKKDGILGWYSGIQAKLLQTVLMAAFHFWCYEQIKFVIFKFLAPERK